MWVVYEAIAETEMYLYNGGWSWRWRGTIPEKHLVIKTRTCIGLLGRLVSLSAELSSTNVCAVEVRDVNQRHWASIHGQVVKASRHPTRQCPWHCVTDCLRPQDLAPYQSSCNSSL